MFKNDLSAVLACAVDTAFAGDIAAAAEMLNESLVHVESTPLQHAMLVAIDGTRQIFAGHYYEALPQLLPVLGEIERSDYADKIDWLYTAIGFALGNLGDPERGLEWTARALAMTENTPTSIGCRKALNTQGALLAMLDQHDASIRALERALQIAIDQGVARSQAVCLGNCRLPALTAHGSWMRHRQRMCSKRWLDKRLITLSVLKRSPTRMAFTI